MRAEERKIVSVLFCDVVGFTAASEQHDPEDVRRRIRPYHARLRQEIERYGGTVEKFIGDAVVAAFGAPFAHEDDAERAVRAGLAISEAIADLNVAGIAYAGSGLSTARASARFAAGSLNLQGTLSLISDPVGCPPGVPPDATECRARTGEGLLPGLGRAAETYTWSFRIGPPTCPANVGKPLATTGRLVVEGKGEIRFALADGARCIDQESIRNEPQELTITGGTGTYVGASGSGRLERAVSAGHGTETWTGTLVVPGFEFDVTPPVLSGGRSRTVRAPKRAKRVRVTYTVTANDTVEGQVPVTCLPRSGSRFPIGRTTVTCEATDSSGNTGRARFVVTVKRRR